MNVTQKIEANIWADDRLGFADIGQSFTKIIQTIDDSKVISIEAPFGYGKTFFRREWAKQLRANGELVIEIDALQSDHSGDPLITFMGSLLAAKPRSGKPLSKVLKDKALKVAGLLGRASMRVVLRESAEEFFQAGAEWVKGKSPDIAKLDDAIDIVKGELTSVAGQLIATHLAAERARVDELPTQIDALRDALTEDAENKRIVIIVDELDRCQPEYAISLLEAMKLVFGREGFVFVLMVNPNYLEDVAKHRFGFKTGDELYLDKFIDIRLKLPISNEGLFAIIDQSMAAIFVERPIGAEEIFGVPPAIELAKKLATAQHFSVRNLKKLIERISLAVACYPKSPIDLPLLTLLAFEQFLEGKVKFPKQTLKRSGLNPETARAWLDEFTKAYSPYDNRPEYNLDLRLKNNFPELLKVPEEMYMDGTNVDPRYNFEAYKIVKHLAPTYIPSHQAMLDGVMRLQAE